MQYPETGVRMRDKIGTVAGWSQTLIRQSRAGPTRQIAAFGSDYRVANSKNQKQKKPRDRMTTGLKMAGCDQPKELLNLLLNQWVLATVSACQPPPRAL